MRVCSGTTISSSWLGSRLVQTLSQRPAAPKKAAELATAPEAQDRLRRADPPRALPAEFLTKGRRMPPRGAIRMNRGALNTRRVAPAGVQSSNAPHSNPVGTRVASLQTREGAVRRLVCTGAAVPFVTREHRQAFEDEPGTGKRGLVASRRPRQQILLLLARSRCSIIASDGRSQGENDDLGVGAFACRLQRAIGGRTTPERRPCWRRGSSRYRPQSSGWPRRLRASGHFRWWHDLSRRWRRGRLHFFGRQSHECCRLRHWWRECDYGRRWC